MKISIKLIHHLFTDQKRLCLIIVSVIILIGMFLRTYQIISRFEFDHDGDLYSWIVKDVVVNHHFRLIGQLTSAPGIYIGPLFYYSLIPFFLMTHMDPVGGIIPITILGFATLISYYLVFSKLFNPKVGLIATFINAISLTHAHFDRSVVPSTLTNLWLIWYFYAIVSLSRGNYKILPLLAILISLIWHIHIALLPCLIAIPIAIIFSKKLPSLKQVGIFTIVLLITSLPLIIFEGKHGFSQTHSLIQNFTINHGGGKGLPKLDRVMAIVDKNTNNLFFYPNSLPFPFLELFPILLLVSAFLLIKQKVLKLAEVMPWIFWFLGVIGFYVISTSLISEYYFYNLDVLSTAIVSLWLFVAAKSSKLFLNILILAFVLITLRNCYFYVSDHPYLVGYVDRKAVASYITQDAKKHNFPCVAVSYITSPGENVGFRYFFWLDNLHVNQPASHSPVYTIVIPSELAQGTPSVRFGHIQVIGPSNVSSSDKIAQSCSGQNANLTDPMFGYVQ